MGFALAEMFSAVKLVCNEIRRPRLRIVRTENDSLLTKGDGATEETWFGFMVKNVGKRVAVNVRCQIVRIEYLDRPGDGFEVYSKGALDLYLYSGQDNSLHVRESTIVPGAEVEILLAYCGSEDILLPAVSRSLDYFEDLTAGAVEYRFCVVAFDNSNRFVPEIITIAPKRKR